jgi:hypothetical protein
MHPKTGWQAEALVQVAVVARTGIEAEALSNGNGGLGKANGGGSLVPNSVNGKR